MQNTIDFENRRDGQHDKAQSLSLSEEHVLRRFTHDYLNDTTMEYTRNGAATALRLIFESEDPDAGLEEMLYHGDNGETMDMLVDDLRNELSTFLDEQDSSSFYTQQGISIPNGIHSLDDYFGEFTRTALYAYESVLMDYQRDRNTIEWHPIENEKKDWLFSAKQEDDLARGCIGHLRGDFGRDGNEFWTSWFDHQVGLKTSEFRSELQETVNKLRKPGGFLHDFASMQKQCAGEYEIADGSYGFRMETKEREYYLRCIPRRGDYNLYLYCYDKAAQRAYALSNQRNKQTAIQQQHKPKRKEKER